MYKMHLYKIMKITVFIALLFLAVSCAPQKEIVFVPETLPPVACATPPAGNNSPFSKVQIFFAV